MRGFLLGLLAGSLLGMGTAIASISVEAPGPLRAFGLALCPAIALLVLITAVASDRRQPESSRQLLLGGIGFVLITPALIFAGAIASYLI